MLVVVPNYVSEAIYKKIDEELKNKPDLKNQRENIFNDLLSYFNDTGKIPEFDLSAR